MRRDSRPVAAPRNEVSASSRLQPRLGGAAGCRRSIRSAYPQTRRGAPPSPRPFHINARTITDFLGGGENIRSKDFMVMHMMPEIFLSTMVLDGIFEQFPRLRGGCIEQGAMWIVPWLAPPHTSPGS